MNLRFLLFIFLSLLGVHCSSPDPSVSELQARRSPAWINEGVVYEISLPHYVREGTFRALERRVPEIRAFNATAVLLLPIYPRGSLNRKGELANPYAVQDYYDVNAHYGTKDDFRSLVKMLHAHEIKVILDLPIAETSWDNRLIIEHPDWFVRNDEGAIISPDAESYDVAALNYEHHELKKYMIEMMKFWVREFDVDGFRCIRAGRIPLEFWKIARREVEKVKPIVMIADTAVPEFHLEAFDVTPATETTSALHAVFAGTADCSILRKALSNERAGFPKGAIRARTVGLVKNDSLFSYPTDLPPDAIPTLLALVSTLPGVPVITAGIESRESKGFPLTENAHAGFVADPRRQQLLRKLAALRRDVIGPGRAFELLELPNPEVIAFMLRGSRKMFVGLFNVSQRSVNIEMHLPVGKFRDYMTNEELNSSDDKVPIQLIPFAFKLYVSESSTEVP